MKKRNNLEFLLLGIVLLAAFFRIYGYDWDQGQHLHPDERFLTMVVTSMKIPSSISNYLNPQKSTMNPYNLGYNFFVYGTFPLNLTKIIGVITQKIDYGNIHFVGRFLSAVFDLGVVLLLFKIGQKIFNQKAALLASFFYSVMVLPIQLSHFFATDTFLNFFIVLSFYFLVLLISESRKQASRGPGILKTSLLGISLGFALACKITALYFSPIIGLGYLYLLYLALKPSKSVKILTLLLSGMVLIISSALVFRINQPQAFSSANFLNWQPNQQFIKNLKDQKSYDNPESFFPPAVQWKKTKAVIFPLKNIILWGLGLPLGIIALLGFFYFTYLNVNKIKSKGLNKLHSGLHVSRNLIVIWILGLLLFQGSTFVKTMRYFLPIYPFVAITSAVFISKLGDTLKGKFPKKFYILHFTFYILILVYPISFLSIYSHPTTRVSASEWIYKNIPAGVTILEEEWDDGLPLPLPNYPWEIYKKEPVLLYDPDTAEKWQKINQKLAKADYIFLTSNRAYSSTMKDPQDYPQTIKYYQSLFNGSGNFEKIAEFTSRPCFPPVGKPFFCFRDDEADEAFTVYDHPKVLIFKKK